VDGRDKPGHDDQSSGAAIDMTASRGNARRSPIMVRKNWNVQKMFL
jgi:hypothetical protein